MNTQPGNDVGQVSGLAQLWQSAIEDYEEKTKKSLQQFCHDQPKVDTAVRNNVVLIQKLVNTVQVDGNVTSVRLEDKASTYVSITDRPQAFPPAMPASLIFTAFKQVMQVQYSK